MKVLVLNCGSSSIKYQLFDMPAEKVLAKGVVEKIGLPDSFVKHEKIGNDKEIINENIPDHKVGIDLVLKLLVDAKRGCLTSVDEIEAVGHRVAHGGEKYNKSVKVDSTVIEEITKYIPLAPLHNPANLAGIRTIEQILPKVPQVAVFDTAFHQTMPDYAFLYAIPYNLYEKYGIRKYGFHGTSHKYISEIGAKIAGIDLNNSKIITCHLGNGGSLSAVLNGKSIDTSMGLTPDEGVMMGTRCGDIDVGAVLTIAEMEHLDLKGLNNLVNKKSGLLGVSMRSSDMRDIENGAKEGDKNCILALEMYAYRVKKYIGAYAAVMNGVDLIIFAGGIGENDASTRGRIMKNLEFLGINFDFEKNNNTRGTAIISKPDSKVKVMVVETNEELVIANDTMRLIK